MVYALKWLDQDRGAEFLRSDVADMTLIKTRTSKFEGVARFSFSIFHFFATLHTCNLVHARIYKAVHCLNHFIAYQKNITGSFR